MTSILNALREDILRTYQYHEGNRFIKMVNTMRAPGVQAVAIYRFGQWCRLQNIILRIFFDPIYLLLNGLLKILWGIELPRGARIGPGLYIGHFGGITISPASIIGSNCNIAQNVTIGVAGKGAKRGVPIIGNNVHIAVGARVFGKIVIGNNVKIGANTVVNADIPDDSIAILSPGYVIVTKRHS
jgi:serine O-acetyltransferase